MRELAKGNYCRHKVMDAWGVGQVKSTSDERLTIFFEHVGTKPIARPYAQPMLVAVPGEQIPAEIRAVLDAGEQKNALRAGKSNAVDKICNACGKQLKRVVYADKRHWKSCPKCSVRNGDFHTFYEYPRAFESAEAKAAPAVAQSSCAVCRNDAVVEDGGRLCGTL